MIKPHVSLLFGSDVVDAATPPVSVFSSNLHKLPIFLPFIVTKTPLIIFITQICCLCKSVCLFAWTTFGRDNLFWLIDVACANWMGRPLIIFFSIVRLLVLYGMPFSVILGCLGLCLIARQIWLHGREVVLGVLWCGRWSLFVLCGVCGGI